AFQELIVDNTCMQLVMNPYQFDVMVMQNFYGDIVSGLCNGIAGGISVVPGVSLGDAPELVGKNAANPLPLLVSALYMLRHLGCGAIADRITAATESVLTERRH